ncbi:MAG: bifunctional diaminohydroxyphosphoribosylaminopyrimidine deaminase/5-amino-6-(5-phosphoribosylamino)uracil reductase RibD [Desulfamplus sp.]|nr:bifunctional diaminohydroxyphosphoribosylaminopyrimidine deaminase/5-amino-6-(5-phosphoribosylamino)uracil reductase RibD [Desulfamplus sp.]
MDKNPLHPNDSPVFHQHPNNDISYMQEAIHLAAKGRGYTSPNPMVGAVVVKNNQIVGRGWHRACGLAHAEVEAINDAGENAAGSDIYVTLEPCNHYGKTPPCTKKIIASGIRRVVVAAQDPNPFVIGGGIQYLREHGIEVEAGVCKDEAETLIEDFIWYIQNDKKPFVILKCASTLDGRLATSTGDSKWITCEKSRQFVHQLRHAYDAILVGSGTVHKDNPSLTARIKDKNPKDPHRVILDSNLSINLDSNILTQPSNANTIIATSYHANPEKRAILENMGVTVLAIPEKLTTIKESGCLENEKSFLDFENLLEQLGKMGIMSVFIEGGSTVIGSALSSGIVNKVLFFIAPKILGGDDGVPICRGKSPLLMKDAMQLRKVEVMQFDDDTLIQGYLK